MLAAKNERHAMGATFLFNIAHYALRPWPWILVALASLVVFPDLESLKAAFPGVAPAIIKHDLAYPAMLTFLPAGLLGLVIASLIAAFMSTISTHLNWGASYIVNDFYKRFLNKNPREKQMVMVGRISIVVLMILAALLALLLQNALQAFHILLQIGAGTGLLFLLRWFWWRINAASELAAMMISFMVAVYFEFIHRHTGLPEIIEWKKLIIGVIITTVGWITVTLVTRPTEQVTLLSFYRKIRPGGPGWKKVLREASRSGEDVDSFLQEKWDFPTAMLAVLLGILTVYSILFAIGFWLYDNVPAGIISSVTALFSSVFLIRSWKRIRFK
jgi:SSS family solute:Na+ symporter